MRIKLFELCPIASQFLVNLRIDAGHDGFWFSHESECRVGASAPRCRVVPSVTLATGGLNSAVLLAGKLSGGAT
jgi:hypothetical protein